MTYSSTKPDDESWLMTVSGVPKTGTLSDGARDSSSGDWYILVPPNKLTTEISIQAGASIVNFVVTPVADKTFIRAPRFIGKNPDGTEILEDQEDDSGNRIPIKIPVSIELPDSGESLDKVVITGLPEDGLLQLKIDDVAKGSAISSETTTYEIPGSNFGYKPENTPGESQGSVEGSGKV